VLLSRQSKFPLQNRSEFLNGRELTHAAHEDALFVMMRTNSNRAAEDFFKAPPDSFARDARGEPYRAADKHIARINSDHGASNRSDNQREY